MTFQNIIWSETTLLVEAKRLKDIDPDAHSHARLPVSVKESDSGNIRIYFASRSTQNIEKIYQIDANIRTKYVDYATLRMCLDFSPSLGSFDDNGVCPCSVIVEDNIEYLSYCGWNIHKKVHFRALDWQQEESTLKVCLRDYIWDQHLIGTSMIQYL